MTKGSNLDKRVSATDIEHVGALAAGALLTGIGYVKGGAQGTLFRIAGLALLYRGAKNYRPLYDAVGIKMAERPAGVSSQSIRVESMAVIDRPRDELYRIWRNVENLPVFMSHLLSVDEEDDVRSHWVARAPGGMVVEWDAEIINDIENELIAWHSLQGSGVVNSGSVHFEPEALGTRLRIVLRYDPPGDRLGAWVAKAFRSDPQAEIDEDLENFKRIMEVGSRTSTPAVQAEMM